MSWVRVSRSRWDLEVVWAEGDSSQISMTEKAKIYRQLGMDGTANGSCKAPLHVQYGAA